MSVIDEAGVEVDSATTLGVTLLGQLVRHLAEAHHVIEFVAGQVDLNLGEVASAVDQAAYEANQAFEAASLLLRRAALDESWSRNASRPKAIFARHNAAVAAGAARVEPARAPLLIRREPSPVTREERPPKPPGASRPQCGQHTKTTNRPCENRVVVLEYGALASACATHLPDSERPSYERQKAQTDAWLQATAEHQQHDSIRMMADATRLWLRRQATELGLNWDEFCQTVEIAASPTSNQQYTGENDGHGDGWSPCRDCSPYISDTVALAGVGMRFLHGWAADQDPPRWANPTLPPGDWLFAAPPKALAHRRDLGLSMAASIFAEIATPTDDIANAVDVRYHEIIDSMLGPFSHVDSLHAPAEDPSKPRVAPPAPGTRPARTKRPKKKRGKR